MTILLSRGNSFFKYYNINSFKHHSIYINFYTTYSWFKYMVTKVMVTGVKVGPHTTVKDFCDKVWDNITGKNNQYMRVDVVSDNYKSPHLLKK